MVMFTRRNRALEVGVAHAHARTGRFTTLGTTMTNVDHWRVMAVSPALAAVVEFRLLHLAMQ